MEEPKSLDSLFKEKLFRIPDYQRGYAWKKEQLKDFWEDLVNLSENRSHYTGVLTLMLIPKIDEREKEYWLVEDHSYKRYHIVDGQQRLTTFIIFLQAFVEFVKALPENRDKADDAVYITESLSIESVRDKYLFKIKPTGDHFRTYKFGYETDNPSYDYLRYKILGEEGVGSVKSGRDYRQFLLEDQFTPKNVRKIVERQVILAIAELWKSDGIFDLATKTKKVNYSF